MSKLKTGLAQTQVGKTADEKDLQDLEKGCTVDRKHETEKIETASSESCNALFHLIPIRTVSVASLVAGLTAALLLCIILIAFGLRKETEANLVADNKEDS